LFGAKVFQHAENFHLEFFDLIAGEHGFPNSVLACADLAQR